MPTAVRRAAWAEWAGWTCKERQRSVRPDVQRLVREDRKPPAGNCRGFFVCGEPICGQGQVPGRARESQVRRAAIAGRPDAISSYSCLEGGRASASNASHMQEGSRGTLHPRRHSAMSPAKGTLNVFVESCCAHEAHGNGPAFSPAASPAARRRGKRAIGAEGPAKRFFQEQEVLHTRSGFALFAHSLIRRLMRHAKNVIPHAKKNVHTMLPSGP